MNKGFFGECTRGGQSKKTNFWTKTALFGAYYLHITEFSTLDNFKYLWYDIEVKMV